MVSLRGGLIHCDISNNWADTLLDLHAKLQTAVRYYDRMLEDRLSKAFHHQNLGGYNLPTARQASSPYTTLPAHVPMSHAGPAESFYGAEQPQHDYGRPLAQPSYPHPSQPTPQPQYAVYDKRASISGPSQHQYPQQHQRQDSWAASAPPNQYPPQQNYTPSETATPQMSHLPLPQQQPSAPESVGTTPTSDPNTSLYFQQPGQNQQGSPSAPSEVAQSPYPNFQQSMQPYSQQPQPVPETPTPAAHAQPVQQQAPPPPQQQPQQPQAPYWQHPAAQHVPVPVPSSAPWQQHQQPQQYGGYQQEAFPAAPQHVIAPQQPAVEEALIEL